MEPPHLLAAEKGRLRLRNTVNHEPSVATGTEMGTVSYIRVLNISQS